MAGSFSTDEMPNADGLSAESGDASDIPPAERRVYRTPIAPPMGLLAILILASALSTIKRGV